MGRFDVTAHAVERYVERHAPGTPFDVAFVAFNELLKGASPVRSKSINGQALWRVDDPPMLLVTKRDGGRVVVVTVLPPSAVEEDADAKAAEEEMLAAYERIRPLVEREETPRADADDFARKFRVTCDGIKDEIAKLREVRLQLRNGLFKAGEDAEARRLRVSLLEAAQREASLEGKLARQLAHGDLMRRERNEARAALRVVARALAARCGEPWAAEALVEAARFAPYAVDEAFLKGDDA